MNGWISRNLEESIPVQYATLVNTRRDEIVVLEELESVPVVRLWRSGDGLSSGLGAMLNLLLTIGDSFNLVAPNKGVTLVLLGEKRLRTFFGVVHSYFSLQHGLLYDHFEYVIRRAASQAVLRTADI